MNDSLKTLLIVAFLLVILWNLGAGLYYLLVDRGQSKRTVNALTWRICWHRIGLAIVLLIAVFGAIFATVAFNHLVSANVRDCLNGSNPLVVTKAP